MNLGSVFRFDRFELQTTQRLLLRDGQPVQLGARAFDMLVALTERAGRLVTKDELLDVVWPGLVVEENNVAAQIVALRRALHSELIVTVPGRGYRFAAQPTAVEAPQVRAARPLSDATGHPQSMPLFGRESDLRRLQGLVARPGCVTLVGPGGVGKTSLAHTLCAGDPGPVHWIDLAAVESGDQLIPALQRLVGQPAGEGDVLAALGNALGGSPLLVLDNAEHMVDAVAALVPRLLVVARALRLLVTSQAPLAITGEQVDRLDPLALPTDDMADAQALDTASVTFFLHRVRMTHSRWQHPMDATPRIRQLCADLDGLPLALEMAAARVPTLGLAGVHEALGERFALLRKTQRDTPARHRTLLATLQWSYALLAPEEQRLLRFLGVFVGGFTAAMAAEVASGVEGDRWETIDRLATLVERSLVALDDQDPPRYRLLESTRAFALAQLAGEGEEHEARSRHAAVLDRLFGEAEDTEFISADAPARARALAEMGNVRSAIVWSLQHDAPRAVRLNVNAAALTRYSAWRSDAVRWMSECEPLLDQHVDAALQLRWWVQYAQQCLFGRSARVHVVARRAVALSRAAANEWHLLWALITLVRSKSQVDSELTSAAAEMQALLNKHPGWRVQAHIATLGSLAIACELAGDHEATLRHRLAELALVQQSGLAEHLGVATNNVANALHLLGRNAEALDRLEAYLAHEPEPDGYNAVYARSTLLRIQFALGQYECALAQVPGMLTAARRLGLHWLPEVVAVGLARAGRHRDAALFIGHLRQSLAAFGMQEPDTAVDDMTQATAMASAALGPDVFESLREQGRYLDDAGVARLIAGNGDG